jgi:hypothetical protein
MDAFPDWKATSEFDSSLPMDLANTPPDRPLLDLDQHSIHAAPTSGHGKITSSDSHRLDPEVAW